MSRSQLGILQLALATTAPKATARNLVHTKDSVKEAFYKQISLKYLNHPQIKAAMGQILQKDPYTYEHCLRVGELSMRLADRLGLPQREVEEVYVSGILHDIGKVHTPDSILKKPGPLTAEEFAVIRIHPVDSEKMVLELSEFSYLSEAIRGHHERYDGKGYPDKKLSEEIHPYSRIILVCDTFDAMTSTRIYRRQINLENTYEEILRCSGSQFDPSMAEEFVAMHKLIMQSSVDDDLIDEAA
ncbi:MAG TPA: HD domain-containing phosphohydrolase [Bdellovibrionota bacterium]|jgi:putative nucleotidyltransferase with HDIG domain|nr:HD domain-containing phosphohydrolase [Bdellovibrionota bacterium]